MSTASQTIRVGFGAITICFAKQKKFKKNAQSLHSQQFILLTW